MPTARFSAVYRALAQLRGQPIFVVGADGLRGYEPLIGYGIYKDFSIAVPYAKTVLCSLDYEGLT